MWKILKYKIWMLESVGHGNNPKDILFRILDPDDPEIRISKCFNNST
jgi:hypothetical protein